MLSQDNDNFDKLITKLEELNGSSKLGDITQKCLNSLKKLKIARSFSDIDDQIFKLGLNKLESSKSDFFTQLLQLETKRLKFKEESSKCLQNHKTIPTQITSR